MRSTPIRQRTVRLVATGLAAAAVAGVMIATAAVTGTDQQAVAGGPGTSAAQQVPQQDNPAGRVAAANPKPAPKATKYVFQNKRPAVGRLAAGAEVKIAPHLFFATKGTEWAVISRVPGEPAYEPFGWRRTLGNDNLGDPSTPGIQSVGPVVSSVFQSAEVSTVVYTRGSKAWYGKIYRLGGIPGWVQSSAQLTADPAAKKSPGPQPPAVSVFSYDAAGKLLSKFGDAKGDPLAK
ncbi:hypothetical protein FB561_2035 [Kribbella amoyensis]|uniref:Uncharacterized protein n=1 Tax=Kribbella amoyensis TaxID=996641 RepID=A0A561BQ16_9ACTN|nr:hypothetical protein [Kribbella amoyensis]TWD80937.1 hypothetical protein FB561_2035 [Kribbella amoyensis]